MVSDKKIEIFCNKIERQCKCNGNGCDDCKSLKAKIKIYKMANIPADYWLLYFRDFIGDQKFKNAIIEKIDNIDDCYAAGESYGFIGKFGTGKTFAATSILKKALLKGYSGKYFSMNEIISKILISNNDFMEEIVSLDFLVIDEFCDRYIFTSEKAEKLFGSNLEYILRTRFQNQLVTILCSNNIEIDNVLTGEYSEAINSLRNKYMKMYFLTGQDARKKV